MSNLLNYIFKAPVETIDLEYTIATAESVTAGALANVLCSEPGASKYFKGGVVAYSIASKKEILGIDIAYAEKNNFANPFTTAEMAKAACKMFKARIGMATTGYSLPFYRDENKEKGECALAIDHPYAYICLHDRLTGHEIIQKVDFVFDKTQSVERQRAYVQAKVSLEGKRIYMEYKLSNSVSVVM